MRLDRFVLGLFLLSGSLWYGHAASEEGAETLPLRVTLSNGLRVVIVQDRLAPVVTVELSVLAGGNESPAEYPGLAHAQEHMAFRGCTGMTSDQTAAIYTQLGGQDNADTDKNVTQYYATVPSSDLDLVLRASTLVRTRHRLPYAPTEGVVTVSVEKAEALTAFGRCHT